MSQAYILRTQAYILCTRPDRAFLIGPFATTKSAATWVRKPENNPMNDPRWVVLNLSPEQVALPLSVAEPTSPITAIETRLAQDRAA